MMPCRHETGPAATLGATALGAGLPTPPGSVARSGDRPQRLPGDRPQRSARRGSPDPAAQRSSSRKGFSQVEIAMSALIAGLILTASLNLAGSATRGQIQNNDQMRARLIISGLMAEILELPFEDPNQTPVFGPETGETSSPARRTLFDDVDDYHNWNSTPQTKSGTAIADDYGIRTQVQVKLVDPSQLAAGVTGTPSTEVKQITVNALRGSMVVSSLSSIVTK